MSDLGPAMSSCVRAVEAAAQNGPLPSVVTVVFQHGAVRWRHCVGAAGAQYRIGSITKTFTAVAVMRLVERGLVGLDDPIGRHLPDAPYADHTLARLLSHASGMTAEPAGPWWERTPGHDWAHLARANAASLDVFAAGERYHYSNLAYGLLGELVTRLEGPTWWDVVESQLLRPLALTGTTYLPSNGAAVGTSRDPRDGRLFREPAHDSGVMAPAGQMWSTVEDLARWGDFLVSGDDAVLGVKSLALMRVARSADPITQHRGAYGLGLRLRWRAAGTVVGHTGSMPGFLAGLFVDPESRVGAAVVTNATAGLDPERLVAELIEASEPTLLAAATAPSAAVLDQDADSAELTGEWYLGNTRAKLTPTVDGFSLAADVAWRFVREGPDRYRGQDGYPAGEELRVVRRSDASVSHLEVVTFIFTRTPFDPAAPTPGGPPEPLD